MLRSILLPVALALVVGLAGSAGYAVMNARTSHAAHMIVQDSLARVHADSVAKDSVAALLANGDADESGYDSAVDPLAELGENATPADSIRALLALREQQLGGSTSSSLTNDPAAPAKAATTEGKSKPAAGAEAASATGKAPAATPKSTVSANTDSKSDEPAKPAASDAPAAIKSATALPEDILPERRLAKIFGAMSARDAAKVLAQMSDGDVRTILSMMGDRQAAAVLSALPADRAARITMQRASSTGSATP